MIQHQSKTATKCRHRFPCPLTPAIKVFRWMQAVWPPCPGQKLPMASVGKKFLQSTLLFLSKKKNTLIQSKSWYNWVVIKIRADFVVVWLRLLPAMQVWCLKGPISSIILIEQSRWIARQQLSRHRNHAVFGICHPSTSSQGILSSVDVLSYTLSHPAWIIALCLSWLNGQCKVKSGQEI